MATSNSDSQRAEQIVRACATRSAVNDSVMQLQHPIDPATLRGKPSTKTVLHALRSGDWGSIDTKTVAYGLNGLMVLIAAESRRKRESQKQREKCEALLQCANAVADVLAGRWFAEGENKFHQKREHYENKCAAGSALPRDVVRRDALARLWCTVQETSVCSEESAEREAAIVEGANALSDAVTLVANAILALAEASPDQIQEATRGEGVIAALQKAHVQVGEALWRCANVSSPVGDAALRLLIETASDHVRRIHGVRDARLKPIAATRKEFPAMVSPMLTGKANLLGKLQRAGVGSALPNVSVKARWRGDDDFGEAAQRVIAEMQEQGWEVAGLAKRDWTVLREYLRTEVLVPVLEDQALYERLKKHVKGRKTEAGVRDRVKERLIDRINSILGLKGR